MARCEYRVKNVQGKSKLYLVGEMQMLLGLMESHGLRSNVFEYPIVLPGLCIYVETEEIDPGGIKWCTGEKRTCGFNPFRAINEGRAEG